MPGTLCSNPRWPIQLTFFPVLCDTCGECLDNKDTVCACGADLADSEIVDITMAKRKNTKSVIPVILEKCWTTTKTHAKAIWSKYAHGAINLANAQIHRHQGHNAAAYCIQEIAKDPANLGPRIKDFINNPRPNPTRMGLDRLTALHLRNGLSKDQYTDISSDFNDFVLEGLGLNVSTH